MYIRYSQFDEAIREKIRYVERRGHVGYIRYLMTRRFSHDALNRELLRLGLSPVPEEHLACYFEKVVYPEINRFRLKGFYARHFRGEKVSELTLYTFGKDDEARRRYLLLTRALHIDFFIVGEARDFYGSPDLFPLDDEGNHAISTERVPEWEHVLNYERRHIIDGLLIDGKTPEMIVDYFADVYGDDSLDPDGIMFYKKAFFNVGRQDLAKTIERLDEDLKQIESELRDIRDGTRKMTIAERTMVIAGLQTKKQHITDQVKRLSGHYSDAAFSYGVLEATNLREMFADITQRTYQRYIMNDHRQDVEVIAPLNTLVGMLSRTSDQILKIDDVLTNRSKKTVVEEMLDVVNPSMERIEREQREAMKQYEATYRANSADVVEGDGIIGFDEG